MAMLVALISDIHDHSTRMLLALERARELGCTHLLCMGDFSSIPTFRLLCEEWEHGLDAVFGNNEWERTSFLRVAEEYPNAALHGDAATVTLGDRTVFFCHYPQLAARAAESGRYDAIFFGHTHHAELRPAVDGYHPLIVNPGDVQGRYGSPSMAVYDTDSNTAQRVSL